MPLKYSNLLSPIKVGNVVLRNRIIATPCGPAFIQGPESWPTEGFITHYANKAKGGAAVVVCKGNSPILTLELGHGSMLDIYSEPNQHYFAQMADAVHFYGAKASMLILPPMKMVHGYDASTGVDSEYVYGDGSVITQGKEAPVELLEKVADSYAQEALLAKGLGFDMCFIHMAYRLMFPGRFFSPISNRRTDEFGGSVENRTRFPLMICERIKKACGEDFLIEISISGEEQLPGGVTIEDSMKFAKLAEGKVDLLQIRGTSIDPSQPTYLNLDETPHLKSAEAIRSVDTKVKVVLVGGAHDFDTCEEVIKKGKADFIGGARSWISDPDWGQKAYEGRNEDVVPCLRCNKCHQAKPNDWLSVCSVNPVWGLEHKIERMIAPPKEKKRVAVVGGGPAGMEAALIASQRGHDVTLYEKTGKLGGQLNAGDIPAFKWTVRNFKEYLIRQINKSKIRVMFNTEATPEMLKRENYNVVLAALGADVVKPPIPGIENDHVFYAPDVLGKEESLKKDVVIIGGGEVGVETGLHLAQTGYTVTLLEMLDELAPDCVPIHFRTLFVEAWENQKGFSYILNARCTEIENDKVIYVDPRGKSREIRAGSVVVATGMKARTDLALKFYTTANCFHMIGDCNKVGSIQSAMRSAFSIASTL